MFRLAVLNSFQTTRPLFLALAVGVFCQPGFSQESDGNQRLELESTNDVARKIIQFAGIVSKQNKYSIVVDKDHQSRLVNVSNDTDIVLSFSTPRIDFEKSKVTVATADTEKQSREFNFKLPLYVRAEFAHRNQFERVMASDVKRLGNYQISNQPIPAPSGKNRFFLAGELKEGESVRKLKLQSDQNSFDVLLAKTGRWSGFSLIDLHAGQTQVAVTGFATDDKQINATEIIFQPIAGQQNEPTQQPLDSDENN